MFMLKFNHENQFLFLWLVLPLNFLNTLFAGTHILDYVEDHKILTNLQLLIRIRINQNQHGFRSGEVVRHN